MSGNLTPTSGENPVVMNVLRSFARDLWNVLDVRKGAAQPEVGGKSLSAVREQRVPGVLGLSRFRDGFEQFPQGAQGTLRTLSAERTFRPAFTAATLQRDGFERGSRAPVDLRGGLKTAVAAREDRPAAVTAAPAAFSASLDDLAALF